MMDENLSLASPLEELLFILLQIVSHDSSSYPLRSIINNMQRKAEDNLAAGYDVAAMTASAPPRSAKKPKPTAEQEDAKRKARLESNKKAARESRRRKKVLVEELQRSVTYFTKANTQLKAKNSSLEAMLFAAQSQLGIKNPGGADAVALVQQMAIGNVAGVPNQQPHNLILSNMEDKKPAAIPPQQLQQQQLQQQQPFNTSNTTAAQEPIISTPASSYNMAQQQSQQANLQAQQLMAMAQMIVQQQLPIGSMRGLVSNPLLNNNNMMGGLGTANNNLLNPQSFNIASLGASAEGLNNIDNSNAFASSGGGQQQQEHHQKVQQAQHVTVPTVYQPLPVGGWQQQEQQQQVPQAQQQVMVPTMHQPVMPQVQQQLLQEQAPHLGSIAVPQVGGTTNMDPVDGTNINQDHQGT